MSARFTTWMLCSLPLLLVLEGCQPGLPEETGAELATQEADIRIANALTTQALVLNALSTNPTANALLGSRGLKGLFDSMTGSPYIRHQLLDPDARKFMEYLTSCALPPNQSLSWKHPDSGATTVWQGQLGACSEWYFNPPSRSCLNRVSACIVARNNAFGRRVELSMRGEHPVSMGIFGIESETRPTLYDPGTSQFVSSFTACGTPTQGAARNCGWAVDYIGRCEPGEQVRLGAGGSAPDQCVDGQALGTSSGSRMVLRVCSGIAGCDSHGARYLDHSEGSCGGVAPAVSFTCPAEGYFNVMKAPFNSTQSGTVVVGVEEETPASTAYALAEDEAFLIREGAFYGTIFDPDALAATVEVVNNGDIRGKNQVVTGSVYRRMYSCYDANWDEGMANATHRVCASPQEGQNCAATVTGPCVAALEDENPLSMCATSDGPQVVGDGDYEECSDGNETTWNQPVTVFLNAACDLMPANSPDLCARNANKIP